MSPRVRKLIGSVAVLAFLVLYIGAMGWIGAKLPRIQWLQFVFYCVAGVGWGVPILPLLNWMNRER
jgi:hypothetical protein